MTGPTPPNQDYDFRFRVGAAIADQVAQHLFGLSPIPLSSITEAIANKPGIYQLFLDGASVYIGQTTETVFARVGGSHRIKIRGKLDSGGRRLDDQRVTARFVLIDDMTVIQISEAPLIETMTRFALLTSVGASAARVGSATAAAAAVAAASGVRVSSSVNLTPWNTTGFGSNVPGYRRRGQNVARWAVDFPADLTFPVEAGDSNPIIPEELLRQISNSAPVWFAIPSKAPHNMVPSFRSDHPATLVVPRQTMPYSDWLTVLEHGGHGIPQVLAPGWRVDRTHSQVHYVVNV